MSLAAVRRTAALLSCLGWFPAAHAADPGDTAIVHLRPIDAGTWAIELSTDAKLDALRFEVDGQAVEVTVDEAAPDRLTLRAVPPDAQVLRVRDRDGTSLAALRLADDRVDGAQRAPGDWTVYHVMVGHFASGSGVNDGEIDGWRHKQYVGGDLQGVLERADHLAALGIDAVWLSPIFQAGTSHGYDVENYYRIGDRVAVPDDPEASLALFRQVRDALAERGIDVILDLPLNHASRAYDRKNGSPSGLRPRMTAARQEAEKTWESWGSPYRYWNFSHDDTRRFLIEVGRHWLTEEGVAGLRLDYVRGVPHDFWAEFYAAMQDAKPGAWLLGECWDDGGGAEANAAEIARYYAAVDGRPQFDSLLDFPMQIVLTNVFARRGQDVQTLENWLQSTAARYDATAPDGRAGRPALFLDNHDVARFLAWTDDDRRLTAALGFIAALSHPLVMFYGTETGLAHAGGRPGFTDASRVPMVWGEALDADLLARTQTILNARRDYPVLRRGARRPLHADADTLVFAKVAPSADVAHAVVGVNLSDQSRTIELPVEGLGAAAGTYATLYVGG
ncbi:MAG: alpha-amylase family glycosyl hydrolase, partial [Acidobacteriota bacterium]